MDASAADMLTALPQVWLGYQQSLRVSEMGLTLNVDVASTAFVEAQPVRQFICSKITSSPAIKGNSRLQHRLAVLNAEGQQPHTP